MSATPTVFVTGATGTQGETVARHLRTDLNWTVHAIARNLDSPTAQALRALGVELTPGTWSDEEALTASIAGCTHLFLNLIPNLPEFTPEVPHARRILRIAKAAGVKHVIYSSGLSIRNPETREFYKPDSIPAKSMAWKREIEDLVKTSGFETWTIFRPAFFMANLLVPKIMMYPDLVATNVWTTAYTPETRLPLCDPEDIGPFAVAAFKDPARFHGQEVVIASELSTPEEVIAQVAAATGRGMRCRFLTDEEIAEQEKTNVFITSQLLSRDMSKGIDLEQVRSWGIPLGGFKQFLEREKKAVKETYP